MPWTTDVIETGRLRLRPFAERDKPAILALETSPDVRRYLGGVNGDPGLADAIRDAVVGERPDAFCIADRETDRAIGRCSVMDGHGEREVGYELLPDWWGRGIATEAMEALLAWAWQRGDDASLIAVTQTANEPSRRLLERLGFVLEHEFEEFDAMQSQYRLHRPAPSAR
jgi:[ribosomal protein S5]-alanine N-acetyltransferase